MWTRFLVELDTAEEHLLWAGGALTLKEDFFVDDVIAKQQNPGQFLTLGGHMRERVFITTGTTVKLTSKDWRKNPSVEKLVVVKRHMGSNVAADRPRVRLLPEEQHTDALCFRRKGVNDATLLRG